ncbi:MAG: hypothetical protein ABII82_00260 [Verrucomicrobiota bacterium]
MTVLAPSPAVAGLADGELPDAVNAALVRVELHARAADGEDPDAAGWNRRCPDCGRYHDSQLDDAVKQDRPAVSAGYLVAPDRVLTADPMVEPRFVDQWRVRLGDEVVAATPVAWAADRPAMILQLAQPLAAARPLDFAPAPADASLHVLQPGGADNAWTHRLQPWQPSGWLLQNDRRLRTLPVGALFLADSGRPVAVNYADRLPADADWLAPHASWDWLEAPAYETALDRVRAAVAAMLLQADLQLRAKPVRPGEQQNRRDDDEDETALDLPQTALVIGPRRVLVLTALAPGLTARIESIRLRLADGATIDAAFVGSSAEFGALVVEPDRDLPMPAALASADWEALRDRLLFTADLRFSGEERRVHYGHLRLADTGPGYKNRVVPDFARGKMENVFLFDPAGNLLGLPLAKRIKAKRNRWERPEPFTLAAGELVAFNAAPDTWADPRNVPLSEADSRRLAWLGVDLQPLDQDLALAHGVSTQTDDGGHGALVTHVHAGSPAARVGLEVGDVLLRVQPDGASTPVDIEVERHAFFDRPFPWERYDEINEAYFDRIPFPWIPAETTFNLLLKDLGFGSSYRLDYARGGVVASIDLTVEPGPEHFMAAPELARDDLGFRVRQLTFETRRFYQLADTDQALVVSKVEAGGAAAVAGLKPYELVTHVNDRPVGTVAEFTTALAESPRARLAVRRMNQNRVVILDASATPAPAQP